MKRRIVISLRHNKRVAFNVLFSQIERLGLSRARAAVCCSDMPLSHRVEPGPAMFPHFCAVRRKDRAGPFGDMRLQEIAERYPTQKTDALRVLLLRGRQSEAPRELPHVGLQILSDRKTAQLEHLRRERPEKVALIFVRILRGKERGTALDGPYARIVAGCH